MLMSHFRCSTSIGVVILSEPKAPVRVPRGRPILMLEASEMAGPNWLKLSGPIKESAESDLAKELFEKIEKF